MNSRVIVHESELTSVEYLTSEILFKSHNSRVKNNTCNNYLQEEVVRVGRRRNRTGSSYPVDGFP